MIFQVAFNQAQLTSVVHYRPFGGGQGAFENHKRFISFGQQIGGIHTAEAASDNQGINGFRGHGKIPLTIAGNPTTSPYLERQCFPSPVGHIRFL